MAYRIMFGIAICLVACGVALTGCRPGGDQLAPVRGKVTYKGRPLPYGTIVFVPDSSRGTTGNLAMADIQPDGTFTLKTNDVLGATPGHHKITISCVYSPGPNYVPQSPLPVKYRDPNQSGLTKEVQANITNVFEFDLD